MSELKPPGKPFVISKWELQEAWEKVKANKGAPGVDGVERAEFESGLKNNLYKIWNRMSSGSYFPSGESGGNTEAAWARVPACSGCRRRRHSAVPSSDLLGFVVVTHPFHPLTGQRLEILYAKRRGADTVFVCSGGVSGQITLPEAWTDRGEPARVLRLSAEGLAAVGALTRKLRGR